MRHRPLVGVALAVTGGMLVASTGLFSVGFLFLITLVSIVCSFFFRRSSFSSCLVFLTIALVAASRYMISVPDIREDFRFKVGSSVDVIARVTEFPAFYPSAAGDRGLTIFPIACEGIRTSDGWERTAVELEVSISQLPKELIPELGDRIKLHGRLEPRQFPGRSRYELKVKNPGDAVHLSSSIRHAPIRWGRTWREAASRRLEIGLSGFPDQLAILKALVLGYREGIPVKHVNRFKRTGSMHIFAISGLHVAIVGILLAIALKALGVPRDRFFFWLLPLLGIYVVSTGMKASALRALTMAAVFILAPIFRRKPDVPASVSAAAILLLFFQPLNILSSGFIFSFSVVICIVMVYSAVPKGWLRGPWLKTYTVSLIITSLAATLAAIPLAALYFGTFSPIALIGNLIVVPLTFCIILCGWLSVLIPWAGLVFNYAAVVFINLLLGSVEWLDRVPYSSMPIDVPSRISLVLWFGGLIYLFTHARTAGDRRYAFSVLCCAVLLGLMGQCL